MAPNTALALVRPSRAVPGRLAGSRGVPTRVVIEVNDALAPLVAAFCRKCTNLFGITAEPYVPERRTAREKLSRP